MTDDTPDNPAALGRRTLFAAGTAGLALSATAAPAGAQAPPAIDTGVVRDGRVSFPNWRGDAEPPSPPPPAPLPPGERVGFALVGLGRLTLEELLPAFAECRYARPVALVSGTPEKARLVAAQYGIKPEAVYGYADIPRLRENGEVRAVYVVTPNSLHREQVEAAAAAGKHVLCEKPMATSSADARAMIAACDRARVKLMVAYRIQYEPHNREVMRMLRSGEFGAARLIETNNCQVQGDPSQWRMKKALAGGGSLPDVGVYCLNTARAYTG
ncbi:MAG: Gfo/Idh/MocA family oxidoreductase, partial [Acetobacteraceae bacterium]|nr:Gfo/Idh/MocA family oxidoreductase [Acetobacteraceae bacterium]